MKYTNMTLSIRNRFLRDNIEALIRFWVKIYKHDKDEYEKCADGLETVHKMLLHSRSSFRTARGATRACFNMVINEMQHIDHFEKPGFVAAKEIFEKRLETK